MAIDITVNPQASPITLPPRDIKPVISNQPTTTLPTSVTSIAYRQQTPAEVTLDQSNNPGLLQAQALNEANLQIKKQLLPAAIKLLQPFAIDLLDQAIPEANLQSLKSANFTKVFTTQNLNTLQQLTLDNIPPDYKTGEKLKKLCPTKQEIQRLLEQKNQLVRGLNNLYIVSNILTTSAAVASLFTSAGETRLKVLENNPTPLVTPSIPGVTPPGGYVSVPISPGVSVAIATKATIEKEIKKRQKTENLIESSKSTSSQLLRVSITLSMSIQLLLAILGLVDILALLCSEDQITQEEVSQDLVRFAFQAQLQGNTVESEYKGFNLDIRSESKPVGSIYRRFAVALNRQGIITLQTQPSFASSEQILIDELKYLIDQNPNLRPF